MKIHDSRIILPLCRLFPFIFSTPAIHVYHTHVPNVILFHSALHDNTVAIETMMLLLLQLLLCDVYFRELKFR